MEKNFKTLGPSSTLRLRTSHSIHKDMIPIPSKPTSTTTDRLAEGQRTQGQQVAFASAWPNQAEVYLHFRAQRTQDGAECVSRAAGYKVVSQFARKNLVRADGASRQGQLMTSPSMILKGHQQQTLKALKCETRWSQCPEVGPRSPAVHGGGPALSPPGVAITTCKFPNFCPHMYTWLGWWLVWVLLWSHWCWGAWRYRKNWMRRASTPTCWRVGEEDAVRCFTSNSNKGSSKPNRSSSSLLALRNGGTRTTRGIGRFQRVFSFQPVKKSVSWTLQWPGLRLVWCPSQVSWVGRLAASVLVPWGLWLTPWHLGVTLSVTYLAPCASLDFQILAKSDLSNLGCRSEVLQTPVTLHASSSPHREISEGF